MAARLHLKHQESVKARIRTSQLINRVQNHALDLLKKPMTDSQLRACQFLIDKHVSDAPKVLTGTAGSALFPSNVNITLVKPAKIGHA